MARFPNTGRVWVNGQTDIRTALVDIDAKAKKTINGVYGDTNVATVSSSPSSPIVLKGNALSLGSPPKWTTPHVYTRWVNPLRSTVRHHQAMIVDLAACTVWPPANTPSFEYWAPACGDLIDRSTITRIQAYFLVSVNKQTPFGTAPGPVTMPSVYLSRRNRLTGYAEPIPFTASNYFPKPASMAAYVNGEIPNVITVVPSNVNGTAIVDLATYSYVLGFIDDDAVGRELENNVFMGWQIQMSNVVDQGQP